MYTKCPECNTVFKVTPEDLSLAKGYVRCGNCQTAFYGLHTLSESPLPSSFGAPLPAPVEDSGAAPPAHLASAETPDQQADRHRDDSAETAPEPSALPLESEAEAILGAEPAEPPLPARGHDVASPTEPATADADADADAGGTGTAMDAAFLEAEIASALAEELDTAATPLDAPRAPPADTEEPTLPATEEAESAAPPEEPAPETFPDLSAAAIEAFGPTAVETPPAAVEVPADSTGTDAAQMQGAAAIDVPDALGPEPASLPPDEAQAGEGQPLPPTGSVTDGIVVVEGQAVPGEASSTPPPDDELEAPAAPAWSAAPREPADVHGEEAEVVPETVVFPEFHGSTGPDEEAEATPFEGDSPVLLEPEIPELQAPETTLEASTEAVTAPEADPGSAPGRPSGGAEPGEWLRTFLGEEAAGVSTPLAEADLAGDVDTETDVFTPGPAPEQGRWEDETVIGLDTQELADTKDHASSPAQPALEISVEEVEAPESAAEIDTQPAITGDDDTGHLPPGEEDEVAIDLTLGLEALAGDTVEEGPAGEADPYGLMLEPEPSEPPGPSQPLEPSEPGESEIPELTELAELSLLPTGEYPAADEALGTSTDILARELADAWAESWDTEEKTPREETAEQEVAELVAETVAEAAAPGESSLQPSLERSERPTAFSAVYPRGAPPPEDIEATAEVVVLEAPDTSATGQFKPEDIEIADETLADFLGLEIKDEAPETGDRAPEEEPSTDEPGELERDAPDEPEPLEPEAEAAEATEPTLEFDLAEDEWAKVFAGSGAEPDVDAAAAPAAGPAALETAELPASDLGTGKPQRRRISPSLWGTAAVVLLLIMGIQLVHFSRQDLVVHPTFGPWVSKVYSALGMDVNPVWDVGQYQIRKRVTTSIDELGRMPITTTIQNTAAFPQPYPLVRLILWDRWGDTVDTLMFEPQQYLQPEPSGGKLLEPYQPVEAAISIVRPDAEEITGFDLDVCLRTEGGGLQCARDLGG